MDSKDEEKKLDTATEKNSISNEPSSSSVQHLKEEKSLDDANPPSTEKIPKDVSTDGEGKSDDKGATLKSGNAAKSKPCREIYRPPSMRSKSKTSELKELSNAVNSSIQNSTESKYSPDNQNQTNAKKLITNSDKNSAAALKFNINAKEFEYSSLSARKPSHRSVETSGPIVKGENSDTSKKMMTTTTTSETNCSYPLKQSKSFGNVNFLQQQRAVYNPLTVFNYTSNPGSKQGGKKINGKKISSTNNNTTNTNKLAGKNNSSTNKNSHQSPGLLYTNVVFSGQSGNSHCPSTSQDKNFNRLTQSKSSGSIPYPFPHIVMSPEDEEMGENNNNKSKVRQNRVRFKGNEIILVSSTNEKEENCSQYGSSESTTTLLKFDGEACAAPKNAKSVLKNSLQKSRTTMNFNSVESYTHHNGRNTRPNTIIGCSSNMSLGGNNSFLVPGTVKRSKSFGSHPRSLSNSWSSIFTDFQIDKWPRHVQESVTAAVTALDELASRHKIELCNQIFQAMLTIKSHNNGDSSDSKHWRERTIDLSTSAVYIFLYFIQREKDRTIMETMLNVCFDTFQKMSWTKEEKYGGACSPKYEGVSQTENNVGGATKWNIFLKFLSTFYSQVKMIRLQHLNSQPRSYIDELSFTLLSLLCDSCLSLIRNPYLYTPETMESLFLVMTSIGKDMEGTFPSKMKLLLASVRDALLGLGPYSSPVSVLSPLAQKTLMQLIELHAANWHLPASAVRYYYSAEAAKSHSYEPIIHQKEEKFINNQPPSAAASFNEKVKLLADSNPNNNKRKTNK